MDRPPLEAAREAALRLLRHRLRSTAEVRRRLAQREFELEVIDELVERFLAAGILDDRVFATAFVHDGARLKGHGRDRLRRELLALGVAVELADDVLAAELAPDDERGLAARLAAQRAERLGRLPADERRDKLSAFLIRRGFAPGLAREVVRELLDG
ncbi:MAG: RecX family transcriptional regulator [Armatimonadetes bacterium]|nr:RecX family transcriptional regulator [Armatimonadota bacterium]